MAEDPKDIEAEGPAGVVKRWDVEWERASTQEQDWRERQVPEIERRYLAEGQGLTKFPILWSNVQILKPAIFSGQPKPDVRRRFNDRDETAREAAKIIERALEATVDLQPFSETIDDVVEDVLLGGRGVPRVRYNVITGLDEPVRTQVRNDPQFDPFGNPSGDLFFTDDDGEEEVPEDKLEQDEEGFFTMRDGEEIVLDESVTLEYVSWDNLRLAPARRWEDVRWVGFQSFLTRDELVEQFGEIGKEVLLTEKGSDQVTQTAPTDKGRGKINDPIDRAEVREIWDKTERKMIVVSPGLKDKPLQEVDDPLRLTNFFPIPRPIYSVKTNRTLVPTPEYVLYQDMAEQLNVLTTRTTRLIKAMQAKGVGAGFLKGLLNDIFDETEARVVYADQWDKLSERGGLSGVIDWLPLDVWAKAIQVLDQRFDRLIQQIYEITGISDIFRGATNPNETLGAQKLKSQFGSLRLRPRQEMVQRQIREIFRMMAEIMGEHFSPETLQRISGEEFETNSTEDFAQVLALLRDDKDRGFRIDVETDSTVLADEAAEKEAAVEAMTAMANFYNSILLPLQAGILTKEQANEMVLSALRPFKMSRKLEELFEDKQNGPPNAPQPPPGETDQPNGETPEQGAGEDAAIKTAELQQKQQKDAADVQLKTRELDIREAEVQLEARKEENRHDEEMRKISQDALDGVTA